MHNEGLVGSEQCHRVQHLQMTCFSAPFGASPIVSKEGDREICVTTQKKKPKKKLLRCFLIKGKINLVIHTGGFIEPGPSALK